MQDWRRRGRWSRSIIGHQSVEGSSISTRSWERDFSSFLPCHSRRTRTRVSAICVRNVIGRPGDWAIRRRWMDFRPTRDAASSDNSSQPPTHLHRCVSKSTGFSVISLAERHKIYGRMMFRHSCRFASKSAKLPSSRRLRAENRGRLVRCTSGLLERGRARRRVPNASRLPRSGTRTYALANNFPPSSSSSYSSVFFFFFFWM